MMNEAVHTYISTYPDAVKDLFSALRTLLYDSVPGDITESMWARLPSYTVGDAHVRLIPFKDHINIEAAAIPAHKEALSGYKLTPKGMLQIFVGQDVPADVLRLIFSDTLSG